MNRSDYVRVVRGEPDDDELAALVVAIAVYTRASNDDEPRPVQRPGWTRPARYRPPGSWTRHPPE